MVIEEKSSLFESAFAIGAILIAIIATFSSPILDTSLSREELVQQRDGKVQQIAELQADLVAAEKDYESLEDQLAQAGVNLQAAQAQTAERESEIDALKVEREELTTRVTATTKQLRQADDEIEDLKNEMARFEDILSIQQVAEKLDEAIARAEEAEERTKRREEQIRELTLQLNRAGIYP